MNTNQESMKLAYIKTNGDPILILINADDIVIACWGRWTKLDVEAAIKDPKVLEDWSAHHTNEVELVDEMYHDILEEGYVGAWVEGQNPEKPRVEYIVNPTETPNTHETATIDLDRL